MTSTATAPAADVAPSQVGAVARFLSSIAVATGGGSTMPRATTVALRVYLGVAVLLEVRHKIGPKHWSGWITWMPGFLGGHVQHHPGWYSSFLGAVVLPHATLFAALVALGELGVSISLLAGVATRLGAAVGILLTTNYVLLNGTGFSDVSNDRALLVGFLVVLLAASGRTCGVDMYLAKRWPRVWLW
jgi:uncharacterized membrane protein YphA (DoxX/SURF4 family)